MRPQIIVRLVPVGERCEPGTWYVRDGVKVDSVARQHYEVRECCHCYED